MKKRNVLVIFGLLGLIGWGVYDYYVSSNKIEEIKQEEKSLTSSSNKDVKIGIQEGQAAPDFQLQTLDGNTMKLSDLKGKKVILNFWATWCPPCKAEIPHMQEFYLEQTNDKVEILAVNLTTGEKNQNDVGTFVKDYGLTFPVLLDRTGEVGQTYQTFTIPTSYVIDTKGVIQKKIVGPMDKDMMYELVNNID